LKVRSLDQLAEFADARLYPNEQLHAAAVADHIGLIAFVGAHVESFAADGAREVAFHPFFEGGHHIAIVNRISPQSNIYRVACQGKEWLAEVNELTYPIPMNTKGFGHYLRELRRHRGLSLKQVEREAGVSNAYLSQIERDLRKPPHPDILNRLAKVYDVPSSDLLIAAGYVEDLAEKRITREKIEQAFEHVISHPKFRHGTRLKGTGLGLEAKRFIVEVYEQMKGEKLL